MKEFIANTLKLIYPLCLFCIISIAADAQKLPHVQQESMRAPANLKIDGKDTEWNGKYKAYNVANRIFYTLANDHDNLYLTVYAPENDAIDKLINGGITFTVSHATKKDERKNEAGNASIKFAMNDRQVISSCWRKYHECLDLRAEHASAQKLDSIISATNQALAAGFKELQVTGFLGITEPGISVYNTDGIKTAVKFNSKIALIYEMAIPLKHLGLSADNAIKFSYNIKLNGPLPPAPGQLPPPVPSTLDHDHEYRTSPTDAWGIYTLAQ